MKPQIPNVRKCKVLKKECGTTQVSLENANVLLGWFGLPHHIELINGGDCNYGVLAIWGSTMHVFNGFSWGYGGEGPRGLGAFFKVCNVFPAFRPQDLHVDKRMVVKNN